MSINEQYKELASQLGDICFKISLLEAERSRLMQVISKLNELAGKENEAKSTSPEERTTRANGAD